MGGWWQGKGEREELVFRFVSLPLTIMKAIVATVPCTLLIAGLVTCLVVKKKTYLIN